jgi:RES domain-containing protein
MGRTEGRQRGLSQKLLEVAPTAFSGVVFRFIASRFLASPLASAGSKLRGGRFNPPGQFEVLYTALAADTALAEREGILLTAAAIKSARGIRTGILLRIDCRLTRVLDLCDEPIRQRVQISPAELLAPWLPWNIPAHGSEDPGAVAPSQLIGAAVYASGRFEAILSPSAKDPGGRCLAIIPDRLQPGAAITVDDPHGTIVGALGLRPR